MIQPFKATISILGLLGLICIYQINSKVTRWSLNSLLTTQPAFLHESSTSSTNSPRQHATHDLEYVPSKIESYFLEHAIELGYDVERPTPSGCAAWLNKSLPLAADLTAFRSEMEEYHNRLVAFNGTVKDLRKYIETNPEICDTLELHPEGLKGIFPSGSLTQTRHGLLEPIYPPMRDSGICFQPFRQKLFSLDYLVHDFAAYCRQLKPTSRNVLVDLGASLDFHKSGIMPAVFLTQIYERFGFHWDHIYAYEIREKVPQDVFQKVPDELFHAYHWINVGVSADPDSKLNPWNMILQEYEEDDFGTCTQNAGFHTL